MLHATIMFAASNAKTVQNPSMLTILAFEKVEVFLRANTTQYGIQIMEESSVKIKILS